MFVEKKESIKNNLSISKSKLIQKVEKKFLKNDKKSLKKGEKYLSPVFSTISGATYNFEDFK